VLEARARLLGKEHPDTLTSMHNLAGTLYAQGDLAGAEPVYRQVLRILAEFATARGTSIHTFAQSSITTAPCFQPWA